MDQFFQLLVHLSLPLQTVLLAVYYFNLMSVLLNTSAGDIVIDLFADQCPIAAKNFLKLCQIKYYNNCLFYNVQQNFIAQTGDPTGTGKGGCSAYGIANGESQVYFQDEIVKGRKINKVGMIGMAHTGGKPDSNRSQFFITLRGEDFEQFETSHTMFGEIAEGLEVLEKINGLYCDEEGRPYQDVRILHTYILDDPFPDISNLTIPPGSPERTYPEEERVRRRLAYSETIEDDADGKTAEELDQSIRRKEAKSRAIVLEMTGDLPDAEVKPPDEVLFVCKLNSVTTDEDLELIFSRFGTIKSCEVIRDFKTGESLNYAFIEFETAGACIEAYEKMNNVLIDDRRIKVDFSQSVSKLWNRFLLEPRKDGAGNGVPKPGEKPSYYMKQPGMDLTSKPNVPPVVARAQTSQPPASQSRDDRRGEKDNRRKDHHSGRDRSRERADERRGEPPVSDRHTHRDDRRPSNTGSHQHDHHDRRNVSDKDRTDRGDRSGRDGREKDRRDDSRGRDKPGERERSRDRNRDKGTDRDRDRARDSDRTRDRNGGNDRSRDDRDKVRDRSRDRDTDKHRGSSPHRRPRDSRDRDHKKARDNNVDRKRDRSRSRDREPSKKH